MCTSNSGRSLRSNRRGTLGSRRCTWSAHPRLGPSSHRRRFRHLHQHRCRFRSWIRRSLPARSPARRRPLDPPRATSMMSQAYAQSPSRQGTGGRTETVHQKSLELRRDRALRPHVRHHERGRPRHPRPRNSRPICATARDNVLRDLAAAPCVRAELSAKRPGLRCPASSGRVGAGCDPIAQPDRAALS